MQALHEEAQAAGVVLFNEVGELLLWVSYCDIATVCCTLLAERGIFLSSCSSCYPFVAHPRWHCCCLSPWLAGWLWVLRGRLLQVGLDPGIDHMLIMQAIDSIHSRGGKVEELVSLCGGLPDPVAADNPLLYKVVCRD
jgi:Saccharopine dehydrogenase C-terminal domain